MQILSTNNKLVDVLKKLNVSNVDIDKAKAYQAKYGGALEEILINLGSLSEDELPVIYCEILSVERCIEMPLFDDIFISRAKDYFNLNYLLQHGWAPKEITNETEIFITCDPYNWEVLQYLSLTSQNYEFEICDKNLFEQIKNQINGFSVDEHSDINTLSNIEEDKLRELASEAPTVNLLNSLISKGLKLGASDMHIEPVVGRYRVRYRIDGVLHEVDSIPKRLQLPVISRLKILSGMDIAEKRRPQDGKIELKISNIELDIRVSVLPLNDGESVVMRFLKKESVTYDMEVIGLAPDIESLILEDLKSTAGVILLTGPTGSGKTTTLYTFLNAINAEDVKIITLEDPVEYQLEGINQVQINSDIGFDFSAGLRSIVRQDPDVIMLGEIRDKETASVAMQSALTGHLVFSTVHTNDAPSAFTRLLDLGVDEFLLNAAILSIVAQRLARKLCSNCAIEDPNKLELISQYQLNKLFPNENIKLLKAVGCEICSHSGYKGRTAIIEYLRCDDSIKVLEKDHTFIRNAKKNNKQLGMRTLLEDGLLKASKGVTTIEEVIRVAG